MFVCFVIASVMDWHIGCCNRWATALPASPCDHLGHYEICRKHAWCRDASHLPAYVPTEQFARVLATMGQNVPALALELHGHVGANAKQLFEQTPASDHPSVDRA